MTHLILATEFGLAPSQTEDGSFAAFRAVEACRRVPGATLRFEPGTYHFHSDHAAERLVWMSNNSGGLRRIAFPLAGLEGLTIDGQGAEFFFHGRIMPFLLDHARDTVLRDLTIDWAEPITMTADIADVQGRSVILSVWPDCRYRIEHGRLLIGGPDCEIPLAGFLELDPSTCAPAYRTGDCWAEDDWARSFEEVGPHQLRFQAPPHRMPTAGRLMVFLRGGRHDPAIFVTESERVSLENITIYQAPAMGVIAQRSADLTLERVNVCPKPGTDRVVSAGADATHFVGCRGTITLSNCLFESQLDDPTNVHGIYVQVADLLSDRQLLLRRVHQEQRGAPVLGVGDVLRFADPATMKPSGEGTAAEVVDCNAQDFLVTFAEPFPRRSCRGLWRRTSVGGRTW